MILDLKSPRKALDPQNDPEPDWYEQNGVIFNWSESNLAFERAWWLYAEEPFSPLVAHLRATRVPPGWPI